VLSVGNADPGAHTPRTRLAFGSFSSSSSWWMLTTVGTLLIVSVIVDRRREASPTEFPRAKKERRFFQVSSAPKFGATRITARAFDAGVFHARPPPARCTTSYGKAPAAMEDEPRPVSEWSALRWTLMVAERMSRP
jgi:hypothetical protein